LGSLFFFLFFIYDFKATSFILVLFSDF
jgi:hypothetical protein